MLNYTDLHWQSDNNGYEVGYPEIPIIGLYTLKLEPRVHFYIDTEAEFIVEVIIDEKEDEE